MNRTCYASFLKCALGAIRLHGESILLEQELSMHSEEDEFTELTNRQSVVASDSLYSNKA